MIARAPLLIKKIPPKGYHVFVKGSIRGLPIRFLIDTGASKSVIDEHFVNDHFESLYILNTTHQTTGLGANIMNSRFIRLNRVRIGEFKIGSHQFAVLDLNVVNDAYHMAGLIKVNAIIGGDILKKFNCTLDYGKAEILFASKN